jgi:hypothetical protein
VSPEARPARASSFLARLAMVLSSYVRKVFAAPLWRGFFF